jgi:hypothetical protein
MNSSTWKAGGALAATGAWCLLLAGCGSSDFGSVSGTITLDGKPLPDVSVSFDPQWAEGTAAFGSTDGNGRYELITTADNKGAMPGQYVVRVRSPDPVDFDENGNLLEAYVNAAPDKYGAKSELTAKVEPGKNVIDFALTSE